MRLRIWTATCAAITIGAMVGAVSAAQSSSASQSSATKTITVTGCIENAPQSPTGTSGTSRTGTSQTETKFVLTKAMSSATGSTGTTGTASSSSNASEYRLDAADTTLTPHVGHKVEITGTVEPASRMSTQPAGSSSQPTLKVDQVKMVSTTCS